MASYMGTHNPSAPPAPESQPDQSRVGVGYPYHPNQPPSNSSLPYAPTPSTTATSFGSGSNLQAQGYGYGHYSNYQLQQFPAGTHPDVIRSFQMVDRNRNGYIEEGELREALTWNYQKFSLATLRLLIFLFRNPNEPSPRIGPKEFAEIWSCLGQWRAIFERFDRDRSGKIDAAELRDALYSLGYALPPSVLRVLISRYDDGSGRRTDLSFDSFVECGMIVKGLTEKFKEKDPRYTGSATLSYDAFMSMVIPFVVSD